MLREAYGGHGCQPLYLERRRCQAVVVQPSLHVVPGASTAAGLGAARRLVHLQVSKKLTGPRPNSLAAIAVLAVADAQPCTWKPYARTQQARRQHS